MLSAKFGVKHYKTSSKIPTKQLAMHHLNSVCRINGLRADVKMYLRPRDQSPVHRRY
jgi:hypothetical protein